MLSRLHAAWMYLLIMAAALPLLTPPAPAQDAPAQPATQVAPGDDTPAPITRTARLTFLQGAVQIERSDNTATADAVLNMPLTEGARIVCADYGQAEIEFEDGSVVRLTPRTTLSLDTLALDSSSRPHTHLTLLNGLAYFELRKSAAATFAVEVGGNQVTPVENLTLRVNLDDPPAVFAVLGGTAKIERHDAFTTQLRAGESLRQDAKDESRYFLTEQVAQESWDTWNAQRDQLASDQAARRTAARDGYAADQGYGWSDLDANGNWYNLPKPSANSDGEQADSGPVWQPDNADEEFDPYGYGAWVWVNAGYVWVSGYSWGWTPYRCGHWEYYPGFGWGWRPDRFCASFGFASAGDFGYGAGIRIRGKLPPHYNPVIRPHPRPVRPNPIIVVHGPNGMRPPIPRGGPVKIAGATVAPLPAIGATPPRGTSALVADFPVDRHIRQPNPGAEPGPHSSGESAVVNNGSDRNGPDRSGPDRNGPDRRRAPDSTARVPHPSDSTGNAPTRSTNETRHPSSTAAPAASRPEPAAPSQHSAPPPPAPAPVSHSSPPPASSSSSSSSHTDSSSKPK